MASNITSPLNIQNPDLPTLRVSIPKNDITKSLMYEETEFTVNPYAEVSIPLNVSKGFVEVPQSFITPVKKIIIIAPSDPGGGLPATTTIRIATDDDDIDLYAQDLFMYSPSPSFGGLIKKVFIANNSVANVNVQVRIYG
jgi:hypothetical protein